MSSPLRNMGLLAGLVIAIASLPAQMTHAASAAQIDNKAAAALERLYRMVPGSREFVADAPGILVFPEVVKRGFGVVGAYGDGALRIAGDTVGYYQLTAESTDFPFTAQAKSVVLVFLDSRVLAEFRDSTAQKPAIDAPIMVAGPDTGVPVAGDPVAGFVLDNRGLMDIPALEGLRYRKLVK